MKKIIFILLCSTYSYVLGGQNSNVVAYWNLIHRAEYLITEEHYAEALLFYDSAFLVFDAEIATNIYNASVCASYAHDFEKMLKYCNLMVGMGLELSSMNRWKVYEGFRNSHYWPPFIDGYEAHRKKYLESVDWTLRKKLEALLLKDQELRLIRDDHQIPLASKEAIRMRDDSILVDLIEIFDQYGFPSDRTTGIFIHEKNLGGIYSPFDVILRHAYLNQNFTLTPILKKGLYEGRIHPDRFFSWYHIELDYLKNKSYGPSEPYMVINDNVYLNQPTNEEINSVNKFRKSLMLCPFDEFCAKIIFASFQKKSDSGFILPNHLYLAVYNGFSDESEVKLSKIFIKTNLKL